MGGVFALVAALAALARWPHSRRFCPPRGTRLLHLRYGSRPINRTLKLVAVVAVGALDAVVDVAAVAAVSDGGVDRNRALALWAERGARVVESAAAVGANAHFQPATWPQGN